MEVFDDEIIDGLYNSKTVDEWKAFPDCKYVEAISKPSENRRLQSYSYTMEEERMSRSLISDQCKDQGYSEKELSFTGDTMDEAKQLF